jgi:hypothetical protein
MLTARDETGDWIVPEGVVPTIGDLEDRIDVAIAIARSSEAAAMTVADAAIESAEQARRAAELAERAAAKVAAGTPRPATEPEAAPMPVPTAVPEAAPVAEPEVPPVPAVGPQRNGGAPASEEWLIDFSRRADRLGARLAGLARI